MPDETVALMREVLAAMPSSCTWLVPVYGDGGTVVDYVTMAVSAGSVDIAGRSGNERVGERLGERHPGIVGGELWQLYGDVLHDGQTRTRPGFVYQGTAGGVARRSVFDVSAHRVHDGVLVCWQRVDDVERRMEQIERLGNLGWGEYDLISGHTEWSPGMYRVFERDPADGPLTRAEQAAAVVPEDQLLREAIWQNVEQDRFSDLTMRVRVGDGVRHLRVLATVDHDADGNPVKIYGVVQDVSAREDSRSQLEHQRLSLLAEHRVAAQLQEIILPLPEEPFDLSGLRVLVRYLPAERAGRIGGDWYLATTDHHGGAVCAIGDVAGHGLAAATAMAQLRYGLSAWIAIGVTDPGELMSNLNRLCHRLGITSTAIVTHLDAESGALTWAQAGHPAPLLARAGVTVDLDRPAGMLLGTVEDSPYDTTAIPLSPGDLLLFYTDGLVEHRGEDTKERLQRVRDALATISAGGHEQPLARLQSVLQYANPDDDTCLLALRRLTR
jgi:serine phosphatase RsbU (regulator of sigma subunit)/PAS domain-containing protein